MSQMESSGKQWENFRVTVGGADERGSKGFNQIYNAYTYGGNAQDSEETVTKAAQRDQCLHRHRCKFGQSL